MGVALDCYDLVCGRRLLPLGFDGFFAIWYFLLADQSPKVPFSSLVLALVF
jgi:hypothetical protein